ncbi:hypothetical protein D3C77_524000 [compost metagenome]
MPSRSLRAPENTLVIEAVASAIPSIKPTATTEVPSTVTMYSGSRAWIISEEMSMNIDTKPSAQTLRGIFGRVLAVLVGRLSSWLRISGLGRGATFETVGAVTQDANRTGVCKQQRE